MLRVARCLENVFRVASMCQHCGTEGEGNSMEDVPWVPIVVAVIAGIVALFGQLLLGRGEPAAIKRLKLLGEVIETMPYGDPGRTQLVEARSVLATRLARGLIGFRGFSRVLRVTGLVSLAVGALGVIIVFAVAIFDKTAKNEELITVLLACIALLAAAPAYFAFSRIWPTMWKTNVEDTRRLVRLIQLRRLRKRLARSDR